MAGTGKRSRLVKYALLVAVTVESSTAYANIMMKQWKLDTLTPSTSILAEFIPFDIFLSLSENVLPHSNPFLNGIIYMVYFQQAAACLGVSLLGGILTLDMAFMWLKNYLRGDSDWLRDPQDVLDPQKCNYLEKLVLSWAKDLGRLWSAICIIVIMAAVEWDIAHHWQHSHLIDTERSS
ncbi:hypothetical protein JR316_0005689 [Psilocybe cubensis]|uniref:Uncharacterized protein n=2 Tax=Psilocybe cubensis TaxID=181762 RepID=A0ACB8H0E1_PSICU|nr:hypothetical protein JR316_0005689 [Psilocybe cubensis]KAH9481169.1 hypothetical protein JR316_0005689 [Psilocybe cubensis]